MVSSSLALWSAVSLMLRVVSMGLLAYVSSIQLKQFQYKTRLQPLKRLLLSLVVAISLSNLPIMLLHWQRIFVLHDVHDPVTSFATATNAGGMLVVAILLVLIYRFKGYEDDKS